MRRLVKFECLEQRQLLTKLLDIDADGDLDIFTSNAWHENTDGRGAFLKHQFSERPEVISLDVDLDRDGDPDIVTADGIWFENDAGKFSERQLEGSIGFEPEAIEAVDRHQDGDVDLFFLKGGDVTYFENLLQGDDLQFGPPESFQIQSSHYYDIVQGDQRIGDLDQDGHLEWLETSQCCGIKTRSLNGDELATIDQNGEAESASFVDYDEDGSLDIVFYQDDPIHVFGGNIYWLRNAGDGTFAAKERLACLVCFETDGGQTLTLANVDQEIGLERIINFATYHWVQAVGGLPDERIWHSILPLGSSESVSTAGFINEDNVPDLVSRNTFGLTWIDGVTKEMQQVVPVTVLHAIRTLQDYTPFDDAFTSGLIPEELDFDGSGKVDYSDLEFYLEKYGIPFGDSNLDGKFDSSDLVQVFQVAEYEDNIPRNSDWADGDWNGDNEFNSSDLVFAFQKGTYDVEVSQPILPAISDAFIWSGDVADVNYGADERSHSIVGRIDQRGGGHRIGRALFQFELPAELNINSIGNVELNLESQGRTEMATSVFGVDDDWTELGVTWNTQPQTNSSELGEFTSISHLETSHSIDITDYVLSQLESGDRTISIQLRSQDESTVGGTYWWQREGAFKSGTTPHLAVTEAPIE